MRILILALISAFSVSALASEKITNVSDATFSFEKFEFAEIKEFGPYHSISYDFKRNQDSSLSCEMSLAGLEKSAIEELFTLQGKTVYTDSEVAFSPKWIQEKFYGNNVCTKYEMREDEDSPMGGKTKQCVKYETTEIYGVNILVNFYSRFDGDDFIFSIHCERSADSTDDHVTLEEFLAATNGLVKIN